MGPKDGKEKRKKKKEKRKKSDFCSERVTAGTVVLSARGCGRFSCGV
jgi:hypothetical protein